jgi:hypothetical protein
MDRKLLGIVVGLALTTACGSPCDTYRSGEFEGTLDGDVTGVMEYSSSAGGNDSSLFNTYIGMLGNLWLDQAPMIDGESFALEGEGTCDPDYTDAYVEVEWRSWTDPDSGSVVGYWGEMDGVFDDTDTHTGSYMLDWEVDGVVETRIGTWTADRIGP